MKQIPYNINIMNEHGYIIASGNPDRINTLHVGAVDAINQGKTLPMDRVHGDHGQPGVNMPITYDQQIVGVVGITGEPAKVVPLASLLKTAVELLLKQSSLDQQQREREKSRQRFTYHLLQSTRTQIPTASLITEAQRLGIDLTKPRSVVALHCQPTTLENLNNDPTNLTFTLANNICLIIVQDSLILRQLEKRLSDRKQVFGVGEHTNLVGKSADQAVTTLQISTDLHDYSLHHYQQVQFIDLLLKSALPVQPIVDQFSELAKSDSGKEIIATIWEFIQCDLNVNQTAKHLFTHRNTINYRLRRIQNFFHLDPKKATDLFQLFVGYLYFARTRHHDK